LEKAINEIVFSYNEKISNIGNNCGKRWKAKDIKVLGRCIILADVLFLSRRIVEVYNLWKI